MHNIYSTKELYELYQKLARPSKGIIKSSHVDYDFIANAKGVENHERNHTNPR